MFQAKISIDYHFMFIGDGDFLIPLRSELETSDVDGGKTDSMTKFSACREYTAESSLRFDDEVAAAGSTKSAPKRVVSLPPGLSIVLALDGPIDLNAAAAGDPISAEVIENVHAARSKQILVHEGAIVKGRILELRHFMRASEFLISIRFNSLEEKGTVSPLSIRLVREVKAEQRTANGLIERGIEFLLPAAGSMNRGSQFRFPAKSGKFVIPDGFRSKWITVAP